MYSFQGVRKSRMLIYYVFYEKKLKNTVPAKEILNACKTCFNRLIALSKRSTGSYLCYIKNKLLYLAPTVYAGIPYHHTISRNICPVCFSCDGASPYCTHV